MTYSIDVAPNLQITKVQLLDAILNEMDSPGFDVVEQAEFWDDFEKRRL